jgi:protocatechuate 3,4-dioxygenase beta subunit
VEVAVEPITRREFALALAALPLAFTAPVFVASSDYPRIGGLVSSGDGPRGGPAPAGTGWSSRIAPASEPGEPMLLSGTVYGRDGRTPVPGVTVFAYHTDKNGLYGNEDRTDPRPQRDRRPPRLRGWAITNAEGKYEFRTIKPEPYPVRRFAAHVHMHVLTATLPEWWVPSVLFEGDPLISERERQEHIALGRFGCIHPLVKDAAGVLHCVHDIPI